MKLFVFAALGVAAAVTTPLVAAAPSVERAIDGGVVRGTMEAGVMRWKGISFAAPPIGPLRWRAPQPVARWSGIRDASGYGPDCMQLPFPSDAAPLGTAPAEDCLYLNVWRPADASAKLPVVVWIYGGGFVNGGASPPTYAGANLAKQGVVVVSFNYRLGRFGTFAHPKLIEADADHGLLGDYGYMDQLAALRWVRRDIARFGGDPANVTIIGESAGGFSVVNLLISPLATGLFAKAIVMSGGDGGTLGGNTLATAEQAGLAFARSKGIAPGDADALAKLRALPAERIVDGLNLSTMQPPGPRTFTAPFPQGELARDGRRAFAAGDFAHVPVMIGATSDDIGGRTGIMVGGARSLAATMADKGAPVYEYRFSYVAGSLRTQRTTGAGHASDIPFFFGTQAVKYGDATTPTDNAIGRTISAYVVNFAKAGDPNGAGLPRWPRYARQDDGIMDFAADGQAIAGRDPWGAAIDAAPLPRDR